MERKKKKDKVKQVPSPTKLIDEQNFPRFCECDGVNQKDGVSGPSRMRIYGQLGLDDQEKYVLKCAATINDIPVRNYETTEEKISSESLAHFASQIPDKNVKDNKDTMTSRLESPPVNNNHDRLTNIADLCRMISQEHEKRLHNESNFYKNNQREINTLNKETQANQADFNIKTPISTTNKITQCNCKPIVNHDALYISSNDTNENSNSESDGPLVIISVYPKHTTVETVACATVATKHLPYTPVLQREKSIIDLIPKKQENTVKNKVSKLQRTSRSPSPVNKVSKIKIQERKQQNISAARTPRINKNPLELRSLSPSPKSISPINFKTKQKEIATLNVEKTGRDTTKSLKPKQKHQDESNRNSIKILNQSVNRDEIHTKNVPVEKMNKNIRQKHNLNDKTKNNASTIKSVKNTQYSNTGNDVSKVSVNIQSETEFYDVVFEQGKYKTDVTVRKTIRECGSQRKADKDVNPESLDNCLPDNVPNSYRRSVSKAIKSPITAPSPKNTAKINVRDSIELSHRREFNRDKKKNIQTKRRERESENPNKEEEILATKHFTGDDCIIPDPVVRDKEIRALLGIQKMNKKQQTMNNSTCLSRPYVIRNTICDPLVSDVKNKLCENSVCVQQNTPKNEMTISKFEHVSRKSRYYEESRLIMCSVYSVSNTKNNDQFIKYDNPYDLTNRLKLSNNDTIELKSINENLNLKYKLHNRLIQVKSKQTCIHLSRKQYSKVKRSMRNKSEKRYKGRRNHRKGLAVANTKSVKHWDREIQTDKIPIRDVPNEIYKLQTAKGTGDHKIVTNVFTTNDENCNKTGINNEMGEIVPSFEIIHASAYMKTKFSFNNTGFGSSMRKQKKRNSIETIFRGPKKSPTPNLGASALSLLSEGKSGSKSESGLPGLKPRKPFLRRLMSCLVMYSKAADVKTVSPVKLQSVNSSVDSYHISSSLAAFEMSSSLYDTTASFYSRHSIGPLNNKIKRGFFSFLTSRRP